MNTSADLPPLAALTEGLTSVLSRHAPLDGPVTIIERRPMNTTQSHPSEIVRCQVPGGPPLQLLCKYGDRASPDHYSHGHRRGVAYEAMVYARILAPVKMRAPEWYGSYVDAQGATWLVLRYLEGCVRVSRAEPVQWGASLALAAHRMALFQNDADMQVGEDVRAALITYDAEYYSGWAHRTLAYAGGIEIVRPWLGRVVEQYVARVVPMLLAHPTVIHGEFYPGNILLCPAGVYVLDWESTAVGAGEIDLACLLEGWKDTTGRAAIDAYDAVRVRRRSAPVFADALEAARLYLQFRWLGDVRDWTADDSVHWRFRVLRRAAEQLGLL